jgi:colanic acid biosynthesis glycosyl transferase WcaI
MSLSLFAVPGLLRAMWKCDAVFIVSPALSYALTASLLAAILRVRRILVVKDVMPDAAIELGMLRHPLVIHASRLCAFFNDTATTEIYTLCDGMRRRIARDTSHAAKISIVPDTVDANELGPVPLGENAFRRQFVPDGTFAVVHSGNMGRKQDLDLLLRAAERLRDDPRVHFYVFGDGADKARFLRSLEERKLRNVSHFPLQERWMLRHMLSGADVVLVSQLPEVVDIVVPSKLITAMAGGAMVVSACADESETAKLVTASGGGIVIPAGDPEALVAVIHAILGAEIDTERCRLDARAYALAHFDREKVYGPIAEAFGGVRQNTRLEADFQESSEPAYCVPAAPLSHPADGIQKGLV